MEFLMPTISDPAFSRNPVVTVQTEASLFIVPLLHTVDVCAVFRTEPSSIPSLVSSSRYRQFLPL